MTKYSISDLFGYNCEAFGKVAANISQIKGQRDHWITGQTGIVDTFIVVKTNKQDRVCALCTSVSIV